MSRLASPALSCVRPTCRIVGIIITDKRNQRRDLILLALLGRPPGRDFFENKCWSVIPQERLANHPHPLKRYGRLAHSCGEHHVGFPPASAYSYEGRRRRTCAGYRQKCDIT
jgi:hypothetical protein